MSEDKKIKRCVVSLQPDVGSILDWNSLVDEDFTPISQAEKDNFMEDRQSVSYWKDVWRRLKKNTVTMVALGVVILLSLFAFAGLLFIPYGYGQFNTRAEDLHPYHYSNEDQKRPDDEIATYTAAEVLDVDAMITKTEKEATAKDEKLSLVDRAKIKAQARVASQNASKESEELDVKALREKPSIKKKLFGYSPAELDRKAVGKKVFPHTFGTDIYGRDILVHVMYRARVSMAVGICAALLVSVIGALCGSISGYCGGKVDAVMQRIVELIYAVLEMLVVLLITIALKSILTEYVNSGSGPLKSFMSVLGPNLISLFIVFRLLYRVTMNRIIRGQVLQLEEQEYVTVARALGASGNRIAHHHLFPSCIGQIVMTIYLQIPSAIFLESFLSYLDIDVSAPPPSLGSVATDTLSGMYTYIYRLIIPAAVLSVMVLAFSLFGDSLRDALDPKLKK